MSRPTVVLVHGASGHGDSWNQVLPAWSWADVRAPSLPGRPDGEPLDSVEALAAWLARYIERLDAEEVFVVGHSLGGAIALQLALDHGGVAGIALVSSSARLRVSPAILDAVRTSTVERPFRLEFAFADAAVAQRYADAAVVPPETSMADWTACDGFDVRDRLGELRVPVLVVHGSADPLTPARFQEQLASAVGGDRVELPGVGHMAPWDAPSAVADAVRAWVTAR